VDDSRVVVARAGPDPGAEATMTEIALKKMRADADIAIRHR
jgi:hypothetical protein